MLAVLLRGKEKKTADIAPIKGCCSLSPLAPFFLQSIGKANERNHKQPMRSAQTRLRPPCLQETASKVRPFAPLTKQSSRPSKEGIAFDSSKSDLDASSQVFEIHIGKAMISHAIDDPSSRIARLELFPRNPKK